MYSAYSAVALSFVCFWLGQVRNSDLDGWRRMVLSRCARCGESQVPCSASKGARMPTMAPSGLRPMRPGSSRSCNQFSSTHLIATSLLGERF